MPAYKPPERGLLPNDVCIRLTDKQPRVGTGRAKAYAAIAKAAKAGDPTVGAAIQAMRAAGETFFTKRLKRFEQAGYVSFYERQQ